MQIQHQRVLSVKEVCQRIGLSKATVYRLQKAGEFPRPVCLSAGRVGWRENAVDQWIRERRVAGSPA